MKFDQYAIRIVVVVTIIFIGLMEHANMGRAPEPPAAPSTDIPAPVAPSAGASSFLRNESPLNARSFRRRAEKLTVRVRNISCSGVSSGSAFAISKHTLITNRHVVEGAAALELNTWNGKSLSVSVENAVEAGLVDIGIVRTESSLPGVVKPGPPARVGDRVSAVGFPLGGELTISPGRVLGFVDGKRLGPDIGIDGRIMQLSTKIKQGNSGGPVLDAQGRVVAVIYAGEIRKEGAFARVAYAIPMSTLDKLIKRGGTQPIKPCE